MSKQRVGRTWGTLIQAKVDLNRLVRNSGFAQSKPDKGRRIMSYGGGGSYGGGSYGGGSYGGYVPPSGSYAVTGNNGDITQVAYQVTGVNANQAFGELMGIQNANPQNTISGTDYVSGVRDGNIAYNSDKSLDVTNGTVVTLSYITGKAEDVTVSGGDIAHVNPNTGQVVIQQNI